MRYIVELFCENKWKTAESYANKEDATFHADNLNLNSGLRTRVKSIEKKVEKRNFEKTFDESYDKLYERRGFNLIKLSDLRDLVGGSKTDFDKGLRKLREKHKYVLQTFDGRHGTLEPRDKKAAIIEGGRTFIYAARR